MKRQAEQTEDPSAKRSKEENQQSPISHATTPQQLQKFSNDEMKAFLRARHQTDQGSRSHLVERILSILCPPRTAAEMMKELLCSPDSEIRRQTLLGHIPPELGLRVYSHSLVLKRAQGCTGTLQPYYERPLPTKFTVPAQFTPAGVALDEFGNVFASCLATHQVHVFRMNGTYVRSIGSPGKLEAQFQRPYGIAFDGEGNLVVVDQQNARIQTLHHSGSFLRVFGSPGKKDAQFSSPTGVAIDLQDRIYISDTNSDRVQIFSQTGTWLRTFGTNGFCWGNLDVPIGIAIDPITGNCQVADKNNKRVQVFTPNGDSTVTIYHGSGFEIFRAPVGVVVDKMGNTLTCDHELSFLQICSNTGQVLIKFGYGQLAKATAVTLDPAGNIIVTCSGANDKILIYAPTEMPPQREPEPWRACTPAPRDLSEFGQ